jgi:4-hydroxy-3-polyprenylbenzoate decarboxylase
VQVKKQFPGHASKVMSALWGAGQMMFNKIMVVTDETAQIHNYIELARLVSAHVNPQYDIHLGQGPLDILDHSSARFSFGGKMGIDATRKMPEEIMEAYQPIPTVENPTQLAAALTEAFAEISGADLSLLGQQIAVAFIHYEKPAVNRFAEFATKVAAHESLAAAKLLVFVDPQVDIADIMTTVWIATNNIDPRRDCVIVPRHQASGFAKIALDGTRKTASQDNFRRDWPNIVVMNPKTIAKVDARWAEYGIGEFIPSPSLKFMPLVVNAGATVHEASTES